MWTVSIKPYQSVQMYHLQSFINYNIFCYAFSHIFVWHCEFWTFCTFTSLNGIYKIFWTFLTLLLIFRRLISFWTFIAIWFWSIIYKAFLTWNAFKSSSKVCSLESRFFYLNLSFGYIIILKLLKIRQNGNLNNMFTYCHWRSLENSKVITILIL